MVLPGHVVSPFTREKPHSYKTDEQRSLLCGRRRGSPRDYFVASGKRATFGNVFFFHLLFSYLTRLLQEHKYQLPFSYQLGEKKKNNRLLTLVNSFPQPSAAGCFMHVSCIPLRSVGYGSSQGYLFQTPQNLPLPQNNS